MIMISGLIGQAAQIAMNTFKTPNTLFLRKSMDSGDRFYFDAIMLPVEYDNYDASNGVSVASKGMGFEIDRATFERLYESCGRDFSRAVVVQYRDRQRKVWKLITERPFEEIVIDGVMYRLNTVEWSEKRA
ncbi:MAG: hypothetical protein LBQ54_00910 [Planctomycetaceae bacterium]|nr:hypothetical protein [Planctomycetaceae bacterium]